MSTTMTDQPLNRHIPLVLFSAFMIMQANFLILPSLAVFIAEEISLTGNQISLLLSTFSIAVVISNFFWSRVLDRFNRKTILMIGAVSVALVFLATSFVTSFNSLVLSRVVMAIAMPMLGASILPYIADVYEAKDRVKITGYVMSSGYFISLIVIPLVLVVSDLASWRLVTAGVALIALLTFVGVNMYLPRPPDAKPSGATKAKAVDVFKPENRDMLVNLVRKFLQTAGMFFVFAVYPSWLNSSAHDTGYSSFAIASIFFASGVLGFVGSTTSGKVKEFLGQRNLKADALTVVSVSCAVFCVLIAVFGKGLPFLQYLSYVPMIFFQSIAVVLLMNALISSAPVDRRGYVNAMSNIMFQAGIAFGSFFGFLLYSQVSVALVFVLAGVFFVASAVVVLPGPPKEE